MIAKKSVEDQTTVAVLMTNSPEYPVVFFGTMAIGGKVSPINITYNPGNLKISYCILVFSFAAFCVYHMQIKSISISRIT